MSELLDALVAFLPARLQDKAKALVAALLPIALAVIVLVASGNLSFAGLLAALGVVTGGSTYLVPNVKAHEPEHAAL